MIYLKKNLKNKPLKKVAETDAIFKSVANENKKADENEAIVRISIDAKAKVLVWNLDRWWKTRQIIPQIADDHDTDIKAKLIPYWILDIKKWNTSFYFWKSKETSDFVVDCIEKWLEENIDQYCNITTLAINLDNWPDQRSNRTQFLKRLVETAKRFNIIIQLIYYPPYHSKYNPIEHVFWVLERFWSWAILNTIDTVLKWASNMFWKQKKPVSIKLIDKEYNTWITVSKCDMIPILAHIKRSTILPKRSLFIYPTVF